MAHDFHHRNPSKRFNAQYSIISIFFFILFRCRLRGALLLCVCERVCRLDGLRLPFKRSMAICYFRPTPPHVMYSCIAVCARGVHWCCDGILTLLPPPQFAITTIRITCHTRPPSARPSQTCAICADYVCRVWCPTIDFIIEQRWLSLTHDWRGCSSKNVTQMPWWTRWQ